MTDDMVGPIVAAYMAASPAQRAAGRDWYPAASAIVDSLAAWADIDRPSMAAIVAALSPRNPWAWNVQDAAAVAYAATHGLPCPTVTTFGANRSRAWAIATGASDWSGSALKVRSFVANILGDPDAVTVDVWAIRVATAGRRSAVRGAADYQRVAEAYRDAAEFVGETPRDVQAIVWIAAQAAGLGSARRGRHDKVLKRGTLALIAELLTGQLCLAL